MLVKLDNGRVVNTDYIAYINGTWAYFNNTVQTDQFAGTNAVRVTINDIERLVEATGGDKV